MNKMIFVLSVIVGAFAQVHFLDVDIYAATYGAVWGIGGAILWEIVRNIK